MPVPLNSWNQFGGNEAGSGFRAVNTTPASTASWHLDLPAATGTSSPAIGPDGTLYIGTVGGQVVAANPNGTLKWATTIGRRGCAVATPAIADDGTVYCLATSIVRDHRPHPPDFVPEPTNFVVSLDASGQVRWTVPVRPQAGELGVVNGTIAGAPRVISLRGQARIVFVVRYAVPIRYPEVNGAGPMFVCHLAIVDERGAFKLFNRYETRKLFIDAHGGGGIGGGATVTQPKPDGPQLPRAAKPCSDTPIVSGSLARKDPWRIIAPGDNGLYALRWNDRDGALTGEPKRLDVTATAPAPIECPNGLVAVVRQGRALLVDSQTFTLPNAQGTSLGDAATMAGGLRQMYFLARQGRLRIVDSNGAERQKNFLKADSIAFPALSANHVHAPTMDGLRTLTLDLKDVSNIALPGAGLSSPAIGADGSVFVAAGRILFGCLKK